MINLFLITCLGLFKRTCISAFQLVLLLFNSIDCLMFCLFVCWVYNKNCFLSILHRPIKVEVQCGENSLEMEIDTGAAVLIISQSKYRSKLYLFPLSDSDVVLKTYTSEMLEVIRETTVNVRYKEQEAELDLIILKCKGPALFGQNWLNHLVLNWKEILHVNG